MEHTQTLAAVGDRHPDLYQRWVAAAQNKRILLVEAEDPRVRTAALQLAGLGALPILLSDDAEHHRGGVAKVAASGAGSDRLITAGMSLRDGTVDACVAGVITPSPAVLRAALATVGRSSGSGLVSSVYLMLMPDGRPLGYADCVVNPRPSAAELATIALDSAKTFTRLTGQTARVAMLSFSSAGSARHADVTRVEEAAQMARALDPGVLLDGELQFDAAIVPAVARIKAPKSVLAGTANVLIFPSLEAGNIAYKITERLAGAVAAGPVLQGLDKPYFDISRGSSSDDIVTQCLLAATMSGLHPGLPVGLPSPEHRSRG